MARTVAKFTQADIARAIRAAQQTGASTVEVKTDSIMIHLVKPVDAPVKPLADQDRAVL
jgi:hypothetical protein